MTTSYQRGMVAFHEAWYSGCSISDCGQAFWLAHDGIEPAAADEDYGPVHHDTNDVY